MFPFLCSVALYVIVLPLSLTRVPCFFWAMILDLCMDWESFKRPNSFSLKMTLQQFSLMQLPHKPPSLIIQLFPMSQFLLDSLWVKFLPWMISPFLHFHPPHCPALFHLQLPSVVYTLLSLRKIVLSFLDWLWDISFGFPWSNFSSSYFHAYPYVCFEGYFTGYHFSLI